MARYEHLPIYRAAFDLDVHVEKLVRGFNRYHKYSLGTELRERSRELLAPVRLHARQPCCVVNRDQSEPIPFERGTRCGRHRRSLREGY